MLSLFTVEETHTTVFKMNKNSIKTFK